MYKVYDEDGNLLLQAEEVRYIKKKFNDDESFYWIRADEMSAEGLAINGVRYSLAGREPLDDAPQIAYVYKVDSANELRKTQNDIEILSDALTLMAAEIVERLEGD